jgi:hypothetical protein
MSSNTGIEINHILLVIASKPLAKLLMMLKKHSSLCRNSGAYTTQCLFYHISPDLENAKLFA